MKALRAVVAKELRDAVRDVRAWAIVLVSAVVAGPLSLLLLGSWVGAIEEDVARRVVVLAGAEHAPTLVNFLERAGASVQAPPEDFERALTDGTLANAVIVIPPDFEQRLQRGETVRLEAFVDESRDRAQPVARAALRLVQSFNREAGLQRLVARGIAPQLGQPIELEARNLAPPRARGAQMLFIVPWVALLVSVAGALGVAIDVTAGERERGSLEPLLSTPAEVWSIVLGKWLVVAACAAAVAALTLGGFVAAMGAVRNDTLAALLQFGPAEVGLFVTVLVPFAALMAAVNMLAAVYGRSFKEAQSYVSYITLVVNLAPLLPLFLTLRDAPWLRWVPALGQQAVLMKALRGSPVAFADVAVPVAVCALLAAAALAAQARLLRREDIVFGSG